MESDFELDAKGEVITKPVIGWTIASVAGMSVLLAVQYVETDEQLLAMRGQSVPLLLTPRQCLELAEELKKHASNILDSRPGTTH